MATVKKPSPVLYGPKEEPFVQAPHTTQPRAVPMAQPPAGTASGVMPPPNTGSVQTQKINPANDLRSRHITSAGDPYVAQANTYGGIAAYAPTQSYGGGIDNSGARAILDRMKANSANSSVYSGSAGYGADTTGVKDSYLASLKGLQGPDRNALASSAFEQFRRETQPAFEEEQRGVGRQAAALGRVGAGMTTNDLGTVQQRREETLANRMADLARESSGLTLSDRLNTTGALGEGFSTLARGDIGMAGAGAGAARSQQDMFQRQFENEMAITGMDRGYGLDLGNFYSGLGDQSFGQGSGLRDEERGERGYQTDQAQRGIDNSRQQRMDEDFLQTSGQGRNTDELNTLNDLGWGYDPSGAYNQAAGGYQDEANEAYGGAGDAFSEYMLRQAMAKKPAAGRSVLPTAQYPWDEGYV